MIRVTITLDEYLTGKPFPTALFAEGLGRLVEGVGKQLKEFPNAVRIGDVFLYHGHDGLEHGRTTVEHAPAHGVYEKGSGG